MPKPVLLRFLHAVPAEGVPDAELLRRFAAARDEAAFELLVRRHAGAVWKVCRGILRQEADAEDAFQVTFLALATRAKSIRTACVAGWLHRVAVHAALKLRARAIRRAATGAVDELPAPQAFEDAAAVHEELARLPDRYRLPVVLCELEGLTHAEAARALGWPVGTVSGRLSRARDRLRGRLERRGITVSIAGVGATLTAGSAPAVSPTQIRECTWVAVGRAATPDRVSTLTTGVISAMRTSRRLTTAVAAALVAGVAGLGTVGVLVAGPGPQPPAPVAEQPRNSAPPEAAAPADARPQAGPKERALSLRNLRQVAQAIQMYHLDHGHLPTDILGKDGKPLLSWRVAILPYMEQRALHKQFKLDEPWDSEHNRVLGRMLIKIYSAHTRTPGAEGYGMTLLKRFTGPNTLHRPGEKVDLSRTPDGRMMTLLVVEAGDPVPWTKPDDPVLEPADPMKDPFKPKVPPTWRGPFSNVVNAVFADSVALSLKPDLSRQNLLALIYASDGMVTECRSDMVAAPTIAQDQEDAQLMLRVAREMANQLVKLSEEETRLRAELAKANLEPPDTAVPLADLLIELDQKLREQQSRVAALKEQLKRKKK